MPQYDYDVLEVLKKIASALERIARNTDPANNKPVTEFAEIPLSEHPLYKK